MSQSLKLYHKILPLLFIPLCGLIILSYGWIGYATLTERSGHYGNLYSYYQFTKSQFYIYNFAVAAIALGFIIFQIKYLATSNAALLVRTFWILAAFVLLLIIFENYLDMRRIPKG